MPLTPEDVRNRRFTPVRLREGYDLGDVDQFLDEVESVLERLHQENDDLRQRLAAAQRGERVGSRQPESVQPRVRQPQPHPTGLAEASSAAGRLLEIAVQNAGQLVAESKEQADRILADARARSERTENEARGRATRLGTEARNKADQFDRETQGKRSHLVGQLDEEKARLQREVDDLHGLERQFQSRLNAYFESQLRVLAGQGNVEAG